MADRTQGKIEMKLTALKRQMPVLAALLALGGCAHVDKVYESTPDKNFHIRADVDNDDGHRAYVYVYDIDAACKRTYLGAIELMEDQKSVDYGLPQGKRLIVTVEFVMAGGGTVVRDATDYQVQTRPGQEFYADVRYKSRMFKAKMAEGHGSARRTLERAPHGGCGVID